MRPCWQCRVLVNVGRAHHEHHCVDRVLRLEGKKTVGSHTLQDAVLQRQNERELLQIRMVALPIVVVFVGNLGGDHVRRLLLIVVVGRGCHDAGSARFRSCPSCCNGMNR